MSVASRPLVIVLVTLGGLLAGYLSYRGSGPPALPMPAAPLAVDDNGTAPAGSGSGGAGLAARPIPATLPELTLPDLAGRQRSLRDFLGHPLIVNFWATWCAPCRREMPLLQQLRHAYHGEGLQIVGIAVDFRAAVTDYVRRRAVDYPLLIGEDRGLAAAEQFGMQTVLPFSVFADAQGRIVAVKVGELHRNEADYILGAMQDVAAGRLSLAAAQAAIEQRLRQLAIERAKAGAKDS
jgi:thiol-disulfide isomerase/thioredoxin